MKAIVRGEILIPKRHVTQDMVEVYTYKQAIFGMPYDKTIRNYRKDKDYYYFPRNLTKIRLLTELPFNYQTSNGYEINFKMKFTPLEHQVKPINDIVKSFKSNLNVLMKAQTRFGKGFLMVAVANKLEVSTLILVDKKLLVQQIVSDTNNYSDANIEELNAKTIKKYDKTKDIYVTTFQFLNANKDFLESSKDDFGLLVVDECHSAAIGETYRHAIRTVNSRHRLGVSATPSVPDKSLQGLLTDSFEDTKVIGEYVDGWIVDVYQYRLPEHYGLNIDKPIQPQYVSYFSRPKVVESIRELLISLKGKRVLVATPSQELQNLYLQVAEEVGFKGAVMNSELINIKNKQSNLEKLERDEINFLSGLNQLLKGWSGKLDVIVDLFSVGSQQNVEQLLGRVRTKFEGKTQPMYIQLISKYSTKKNDRVTKWLEDLDMSNMKGYQK